MKKPEKLYEGNMRKKYFLFAVPLILSALRWEDIDWSKNQIHIVNNRVVVDGKSVVKDPKTASSRRTVDVPVQLIQKLRNHLFDCAFHFGHLNYIIIVVNPSTELRSAQVILVSHH